MPTKRQQILAAFQSRVENIRTANGYATDAGATVFAGERVLLGEGDPEIALAIVPGDDTPGHQGEHVVIRLPVEIQIIAKGDLDDDWLTVEAVLGDVKKAVEQADRTLGKLVLRQIERGATRTLPREEGSTNVGAGITYIAPYTELWGEP